MQVNYKDLTIILVAYNSSFEIENILKLLNPEIKILIIENSNLKKTKNYFESKYKNISVILSEKNTGQTGGINIGFKNVKSKYCLYMDMDVSFNINLIEKFYKIAEETNDFALLVPEHNRSKYPKSFEYEIEDDNPKLKRMKIVHGYFMFFKMSAVKDVGFYDENIFFYFDETDYCMRILKKNYKIFIVKGAMVEHKEGRSYEKDLQKKINPLRHWHYMWGKFYFNKKHYSYLKALVITFPDLIECIIKIPPLFIFGMENKIIYYNRLLGLLNAMIGKKSWKRPD